MKELELRNQNGTAKIADEPVLCQVIIRIEDMEALVRIRNYFGENDKTQLEHLAYDVLNRIVKPYLVHNNLA